MSGTAGISEPHGDEGFHILAAALINHSKRPYLDFLYTNPPLYAYATALWMRLFGQTWRSAHLFSALLAGGSIALAVDSVYRRLEDPLWRLPAAIMAGVLTGFHAIVLQFGTIAQPYGFCMF